MSEFSEINQVDPYHTSHDSEADPDYSQSSSDSESAANLQNDNNEGQPIHQKEKKSACEIQKNGLEIKGKSHNFFVLIGLCNYLNYTVVMS
ncbi:hypothetical protein QE152_g38540 [Popillia japonica]|uniref:Uncharacterized protein n=1 Tax=Popillia japonica TaxID=7064 RepID=A0AAW1HXT5_POPJA